VMKFLTKTGFYSFAKRLNDVIKDYFDLNIEPTNEEL
jgi:hypothetical protein